MSNGQAAKRGGTIDTDIGYTHKRPPKQRRRIGGVHDKAVVSHSSHPPAQTWPLHRSPRRRRARSEYVWHVRAGRSIPAAGMARNAGGPQAQMRRNTCLRQVYFFL